MRCLRQVMKWLVSRVEISSRCTAFDQVRVKIAKKAFPSLFFCYLLLIGPAKSVPMIPKAVPLFAKSVSSGPGGGVINVKALKRLQSQHADRTDLRSCLRVRIQSRSRTAAIFRLGTPCNVSKWILVWISCISGVPCKAQWVASSNSPVAF